MAEKESEKFEVLEKIGQGSFGVINKVRKRSDGQILCRKEISYLRMTPKEREQLSAEIQILKQLRHPNIVAYYSREHDHSSADVHLYMEYCGNGDLGRVIKQLKRDGKYAAEEFVWSTFAQTVSALYRCHYGEDSPEVGGLRGLLEGSHQIKPPRSHSKMILHRDLKPENIFLGEDNSVKLGDFGLSKIIASHDFASTYVGTPFYMSPEICAAERYTLFSDIWSLGCIMYELCAKEPPFNAKTHFDLIQKIKAGRTNPLPTVYSPELKNVIASCLRVDAAKRPDTAQLINLPIIKLMRKEAEVVEIGRQMRSEKSTAARKTKELEEKLASVRTDVEKARHETDERLRREWEVRAQLEIDKRVQEQVRKMNDIFPQEVEKEVQRRLAEYLMEAKNHSQGPSYVRSCTPTKPRSDSTNSGSNSTDAEGDVDSYIPKNAGRSFSTLGEESEFPSQTDLSELSDLHIESPLLSKKPPRPSISNNVPQKRPTRTPFTRAKTMIDNAAMPSPKDVPMVDPSPLPMAALNLSPRRTAPGSQPDFGVPASTNILTAGKNIFATAAASKWEPTNASSVPSSLPSLSDIEDSDADDSNGDEDFENVPVLPSPTRNGDAGDPFKPRGAAPRPRPSIGGMGRQKTMPNTLHRVGAQQRLASAPNLLHQQQQQERLTVANSGAQVKPRPNSAVPVVATSPARKTATVASTSPTRPSPRKTATAPATSNATANGRPTEPQGGIKSKKGMQYEDMIRTAMRNQIQGRTLVELAQARAGGRQIPSQDEVARWDPEKDDMPSPFLKKQVKLVR